MCVCVLCVISRRYTDGTIELAPWPVIGRRADEGQEEPACRRLSGHKGAVSCLAEWRTVSEGRAEKVLLSGCAAGQVRVWHLETLACLATVSACDGPISAVLLPERYQNLPWSSDCFVALSSRGTVSFVSMKEKDKVRAFVGHPRTNELVSVAWNFRRNYVACLSLSLVRTAGGGSSQRFVCTVVDVLSSRVEREADGSAALGIFADFVAMDRKHVALFDHRKISPTPKYASVEKSLGMSVLSSDLDLMLEASSKQPDLQVSLCAIMLAMHIRHIDGAINGTFHSQINAVIAAVNQRSDATATGDKVGTPSSPSPSLSTSSSSAAASEADGMAGNVFHLLPTLVGPGDSYSIWLPEEGEWGGLPPQLLAHMNLVVLSGLGWGNAKSFLSPELFSQLNTFYGISVPETIRGAPMEIMHSYVKYIEHTNEHVRDASNVLLNSVIANMADKPAAIGQIRATLVKHAFGTHAWAEHVLILASIALSCDGTHDHMCVTCATLLCPPLSFLSF